MEYFDIVDSQGRPTGEKKLRADVHRDGDWHRAVDMWLINKKDEILIQKRTPTKESYPNLWEVSSSGHISSGETTISAAVREFTEELGLEITADDLEFLFEVEEMHVTNNGKFLNNEIKDVYLVTRDCKISDIHFQESEIAEVRFMKLPELEKAIKDNPELFVPHEKCYTKSFDIFRERLAP